MSRLVNWVATRLTKPCLLTNMCNRSRDMKLYYRRHCPVIFFKQMKRYIHEAGRVLHRIVADSMDAMKHIPNSHALDPI